jgi:hypothetical protein
MSTKFECQICREEYTYSDTTRRTRKTVRSCKCPRCDYVVCSNCQLTFGKAECTNCKYEFSQSFSAQALGPTFYKTIAIPNIISELMIEQKALLETVDVSAILEWEDKCKTIKAALRFGNTLLMPPKPKCLNISISNKYACPINACRGIIINETCNVCLINACNLCRCEKKEKAHICDPIEKDIVMQSKPCPQCASLIQHGGGCSAMICTNCGTKFDWETSTIQMVNSNEHYKGSSIYGISDSRAPDSSSLGCEISNTHPRVAQNTIEQCADETKLRVGVELFNPYPEELISALYVVTDAVRLYKVSRFDELAVSSAWQNKTFDLRVQYLTNVIKETSWQAKVYTIWKKYRAHMLHAPIINMYLTMTDEFQLRIWDAVKENGACSIYTDISTEYSNLVTLCNNGFEAIHENYPISYSPLHIRTLEETQSTEYPPCGFVDKKEEEKEKEEEEVCDNMDTEVKPITLLEYQRGHAANLNAILNTCHFAMDLSMLGSGKTFTAMDIYKKRGYTHGIIIAPASVIGKWEKLVMEYGLVGVCVMSFNMIGGTKTGSNSKASQYIRRGGQVLIGPGDDNIITHTATPRLKQYIKKGMMIIIDEIQNIKNKGTAKTSACKELVNLVQKEYAATNGETKSRVLLISGSPIDNYMQVEQFFKTVGVLKSTQFERFDIGQYSRDRRDFRNQTDITQQFHSDAENIETGILEIRQFCRQFDSNTTNEIQRSFTNKRFSLPIHECYEYFIQIVKPYISSYMTVVGNEHTVFKYNGQYKLWYNTARDNEYKSRMDKLMIRGVQKVESALHRSPEDDHMTALQVLQVLQRGLNMIETAKIPLMVQLIRDAARKNPKCKIVMACNFTRTIKDIVDELTEFGNICVLDGSVPSNKRQDILEAFQAPSVSHRILIGNTKVLSTGIDLDDKHGDYPRICFVSPSYHTIDLYQLSYRFLRSTDTKSDSEMYLVYAKQSPEQHLIKALTKKGNIMKTITLEQAKQSNIVFPCDYTAFIPLAPDNPTGWNQQCDHIFTRCQTR